MKKMVLSICMSLLFLATSKGFAGPVIVGSSQGIFGPIIVGTTGGGMAELRAIYMHQNIARYIAGCLVAANPCGLQAPEVKSLQALVANNASEVAKVRIVFDPKMREPVVTLPKPGAEIKISNSALYKQNVPQSASEIGALVLAARWSHMTATPLPVLLQRAGQILGSFEDRSEHTGVGGFNSPVNFHVSQWRFQNSTQMLMMLEDADKTVDITADVVKVLPCGGLLDWRWQNIRTYAKPTGADVAGVIAIDASSACQKNTPHTLVIEILIRKDRLVKEQILISLRGS